MSVQHQAVHRSWVNVQSSVTKLSVSLLALLLFAEPGAAEPWQFYDVERVVAISDIHGAYEAMVQTLESAAVIDDRLSWTGGRTHLVIVGDILDRGPESRRAMELLMRLEGEAASAGGVVHVLIGNHEAMNLSGDLRYVSAAEYAAFAGEESAEERERGFELYRARRAPADIDEGLLHEKFEQKYPPGYFAHRRAFAPDGRYGQWLLAKPAIIVIDGTAFVHGGLSPLVIEQGLEGINGTLIDELANYLRAIQRLVDAGVLLATDFESEYAGRLRDFVAEGSDAELAAAVDDVLRLTDSRLQAGNGPLWYRQNVYCSKLIEADRLDAALAAIDARRVVIGHTPTDGRKILERFDGKVFEVDTGMLADYYEGSGNALVIEGERVYVIRQGSTERLSPLPHPRHVGHRPGAPLSAEEIAALLQSGEITTQSSDSFGRTVLGLRGGEEILQAEFVKRAAAGIYPGVAAYRLDRLLQLDMVPVAVKREIGGVEGTLQFAPAHWIDEQQRAAAQSGGTADCALPDQWDAMLIFDILQGKDTRRAASIRYDASSFQLMLPDNDDAFSTSGSKPARYQDIPLKLGPAWKTALAALTDDVLQQNLADVLDKRRIRALRQRRDLLLSE
jgi:hypothetical protein